MTHEKAHRLVRSAVAAGRLTRPETCQKCGQTAIRRDGRNGIQGHHQDYSKPLEVEWLCPKWHRAVTPLPEVMGAPVYGEKNGQSKLTANQVREIRDSPMGCKRLARIYDVNRSTIKRIRNGMHWSKV